MGTLLTIGNLALKSLGDLAHRAKAESAPWSVGEVQGRLVELSVGVSPCSLSPSMLMVQRFQVAGETVAWVCVGPDRLFAPMDAQAMGVDLEALPLVLLETAQQAGRAADKLLRSGAFGLVVLDLGSEARLPDPLLNRLSHLAREHHATVLFLTQKPSESPSLSSLVSLRAEPSRERIDGGRFRCTLQSLRDKLHTPGSRHQEVFRAAPGLR